MTDTAVRNPTSVPVIEEIAERWSPRGYDTAHAVAKDDLVALFEAARWSASGANGQPWKFVVAARGTAEFDTIFGAFAPWNTAWAGRASALAIALVDVSDGEGGTLSAADQRARFYDVGLSVGTLAVEAAGRGLNIHQTAGTDLDKLRDAFGIGAQYELATGFTIGQVEDAAELPEDLRESDTAPRQRRDLDDVVTIYV